MNTKTKRQLPNLCLACLVAATFPLHSKAQVAPQTQTAAAEEKAKSDGKDYKNTGGHIELGLTAFTYSLAGGLTHYNSWSVIPEIRVRWGFNEIWSIAAAAGYAGIGDLLTHTGSSQAPGTADDTRYKPWTYSISGGYNLRNVETVNKIPGIQQFVFGVGRGNFQIASKPDQFKKGNYVFIGLTFGWDKGLTLPFAQ